MFYRQVASVSHIVLTNWNSENRENPAMATVRKDLTKRVEHLHAQNMLLFDLVPLSRSKPHMARRFEKLWSGRKGAGIDVDGPLLRPSLIAGGLLKCKEFRREEVKKTVVFKSATVKDRTMDQVARASKKHEHEQRKILEAKKRSKSKRQAREASNKLLAGDSSDSE